MRGERREAGEQGGAFNVASLATFGQVLLPMAVVIAPGVGSAIRGLWEWRRRHRQPAEA